MDAEKAAKEKAEKDTEERFEKLKKEHENALVQANDEGYEEVISGAADAVDGLKNKIYKVNYEYGLNCAGISDDHELYNREVLCPSRASTLQLTNAD